jgi:cell division protein FtsB
MSKVKQAFLYVWRLSFVKYVVVCVVGVLLVGFLDENSVLAHIQYKQRIGELQEEIAHYEAINQANQIQIRDLQHNPKAMEKIARERYFMKADDEDIFVLSDDELNTQPKLPADETVE